MNKKHDTMDLNKFRRRKKISLKEALNGMYFDFEGFEDSSPSLMGLLVDDEFTQFVFDPELYLAAKEKQCKISTLYETVNELVTRCQKEKRLLIAYTEHEYDVIKTYCDIDVSLYYANAHLIAKYWKNRFHYDEHIDDWSLKSFLSFVDYPRGDHLGFQKSTSRLSAVRDMLLRKGSYEALTPVVKGKWTKLLDHNRIDCEGMKAVVLKVAKEMQKDHIKESIDSYMGKPRLRSLKQTTKTTFSYYKLGYSMKEIAEIRELTIGTIRKHFESFIRNQLVTLSDVISKEKTMLLIDFLLHQKYAGLKNIKDQLPDHITYEDIRLALAFIQTSDEFSDEQKEYVTNHSKNPIVLLGEQQRKENIPRLIMYLNDEDENKRRLAASALGKLSKLKPDIFIAVPDLIELLNDSDVNVRKAAIIALGKIGHKSAVDALKDWRMIEEEDHNIDRIDESLQQIKENE